MTADHPIMDTINRLNALSLHIEIEGNPTAEGNWIGGAALAAPEEPPLLAIMQTLSRHGFGGDRWAAAASFLLRFGWSSGLAVGAYVLDRRVPVMSGCALRFHEHYAFLNGVRAGSYRFHALGDDPAAGHDDCRPLAGAAALQATLFDELLRHAAPAVRALHLWSGFSERVLWAMVTSSWCAQFANIGTAVGREAEALVLARTFLDVAAGRLRRALPEIYLVESGGHAGICQKRAACCLYFKAPGGDYCASCPLLPEPERLEGNRRWIASRGVMREQPAKSLLEESP